MNKWLLIAAILPLALGIARIASADVLYTNGPIDGYHSYYRIDSGLEVGDSFVLTNASIVSGIDFSGWTLNGDTISTSVAA